MLAGSWMNNSSYKKVRSISEGNFHSCYASNKAEKFKFGRLSQGLESCAQAQALKMRKEEKELLKLYQNIEKEKMKHEIEKKHNQFYLAETRQQHQQQQQKKKTTQSTEQNTMETRNIGENNESKSIGNLSSNKLQRSVADLPPLSTRSKYNSMDRCQQITTPKPNNKQSRTANNKSRRRSSLPAKLSPSNEVIPFYMQHGYSHYHDTEHDYHGNNNSKHRFNSASSITSSRASPNTLEQPCWKQRKSKLSRLKNRRNATVVACANSKQTAFLNNISRNSNRGVGFVDGEVEGRDDNSPALTNPASPTSDISFVNDSMSVLNLGDVGISGYGGESGSTGNSTSRKQAVAYYDVNNNNEDDKLARHHLWEMNNRNHQGHKHQHQQHGNSVLTPFERQELAKYQHRINMRQTTTNTSALSPAPLISTVAGMDEMERRTRHHMGGGVDEHHHKGRRHTIAGTNKSMLSMLRHVLLKKLVKGENVKDLATDKSFEGLLDAIDDGRVYPAYHPDNTLSMEDFNALRKCKYLRVSQLNKESLTEAALTMLSTTEK